METRKIEKVLKYRANGKAKEKRFTNQEYQALKFLEKRYNSLGYDIDLTILTAIQAEVIEQKFYEVLPSDYIPINAGSGAYHEQLTTYISQNITGDFSEGFLNTGVGNADLAHADSGVSSKSIDLYMWAKKVSWNFIDLQKAHLTGHYDIIKSKEESRKKNWDLGLQKIAFLGSDEIKAKGLLNLEGVTTNTSVIPKKISAMTSGELNAFLAKMLPAFRANNEHTAYPTKFVIPESEYNVLNIPSSDVSPFRTKLEIIEQAFSHVKGFKVLPLAYSEALRSPLGKDTYVLYNDDKDTLKMNVPVPYHVRPPNTADGFIMQSVGLGQFSGIQLFREKNVMYFTYS